MTWPRGIRMLIVLILLAAAFIWIGHTSAKPERVSLFIAAVIGGVTTIYALFTFEILLQNQTMAKAALDSSTFMERSLRFSHGATLLYETVVTKDPTFNSGKNAVHPIENEDYARALSQTGGEAQKEFVFAVVKNKGQGAATNLMIEARYDIVDNSSANRESTVTKRASVQILEPNTSVGLCIFISSNVPTQGDRVSIVEARISAGDLYRDAINEPNQQIVIRNESHHVYIPADCVVSLS